MIDITNIKPHFENTETAFGDSVTTTAWDSFNESGFTFNQENVLFNGQVITTIAQGLGPSLLGLSVKAMLNDTGEATP